LKRNTRMADRKKKNKRREKRIFRKKICRFCASKVDTIDFLNYQELKRFITERGKILPSRITGNCAWHQRRLARAIKRARQIGLLPYVTE